MLPAFVISDYHSYILPGLTRHVEAAPFHQAGLKLDKPRYVSIFLEKKVRTLLPRRSRHRHLTRICAHSARDRRSLADRPPRQCSPRRTSRPPTLLVRTIVLFTMPI